MAARARLPLFPAVGPVTDAVLFHGVPGASAPPRDPRAWAAELLALRRRLPGLALSCARAHAITLDPNTHRTLRVAFMRESLRTMMAEAAAPEIFAALRAAGIDAVATKGPGVARASGEAAVRTFGDIDVLVRPDTFRRAMDIVFGLGFEVPRGQRQPRAYFDRRCREGVNLIRRADGGAIDLHHHVPPWVWGARVPFDAMRERARTIELERGPIVVADPIDNLMVVALHLISDHGRPGQELHIWRDLAVLAAVCDPAETARIASARGLAWWLSRALDDLPASVRPAALLDALGGREPGARDAFRLRRLLPPALGSRHQIAQAIRLPAPNAAAFLGGYVVPSRGFLRERYGSPVAYGRWWRDAFARLRAAGGSASDPVEPAARARVNARAS